jgi:hypothetical protein
MTSWYYVQGSERVGPVGQDDLHQLVQTAILDAESYIWKKGFDNWKKFKEVDELEDLLSTTSTEQAPEMPSSIKRKELDWKSIGENQRIFTIKIGPDRGSEETEYGPFTLKELKKMYDEFRINARTLIFSPGMDNWTFLADLPVFESTFQEMPPVIDEQERRVNIRKPFVARLLFHDQNVVYEGICRDVSIGGLQVLVSDFPAHMGEEINMNVHPDNSDYCFVATGKVVRVLDGNQGFSLRFQNLNPEASKAIMKYIQES